MATTTAQAVAAGWAVTSPAAQTLASSQSPTTTLTVTSTAAFPSAGSAWVVDTKFAYTGKTGTTFTGCTGLPGTVAANSLVVVDAPMFIIEHYLDGKASQQTASTLTALMSGVDGFKAHNNSSNTRSKNWTETV